MNEEFVPIIGYHREIGIHEHQDEARQKVVRKHIDAVFSIRRDRMALIDWIKDRSKAPESRLLAKAFVMAKVQEAKDARRAAPMVDIEYLNAVTGGLDTIRGRSKTHYDSMWLPRIAPENPNRPARRPVPLD